MHERLGGQLKVHDRRGVGGVKAIMSDRLEEMTNDLVHDEEPLLGDPERLPFSLIQMC